VRNLHRRGDRGFDVEQMRFNECVTMVNSSFAHRGNLIGVFPANTNYMPEGA
jgi:hypothetical protein